ncbi:hypothetical protein SRHO_G00161570 [Serrasalmus rhombeus]
MTWHFSIAQSKNQTGKFAQGLRLRQVDMLQEGITRSSATLSKLASKLRKVCKSAMKRMRRAKKQKIGSPREVVMIDESKFGHKRKYSQGRSSNRKSWVFGMLGVQAHERRPVLRIVKRRSKRHLMPILKNYVRRGSTAAAEELWQGGRKQARRAECCFNVAWRFGYGGRACPTEPVRRAVIMREICRSAAGPKPHHSLFFTAKEHWGWKPHVHLCFQNEEREKYIISGKYYI